MGQHLVNPLPNHGFWELLNIGEKMREAIIKYVFNRERTLKGKQKGCGYAFQKWFLNF